MSGKFHALLGKPLENKQKINVLQILKGMDIGSINGGAEGFALRLACALDPSRYAVKVCVFFRTNTLTEKRWEETLARAGIEYFYAADWHGNDQFREYMRGIRALREYASGKNLDISHSHFQLGNLAGLDLKSRRIVKKAVRTVQLLPSCEWSPGFYGWARYQLLTKFFFPILFNVEIGVSQAVVDQLDRHLGARLFGRHAKLVYNAVSMHPLRSFPSLPSANEGRIIVVGRLAEQKGHRYLIEALRIVKPHLPGVKVWFVGDGELRAELEALADGYGLSDVIHFLGRRENVFELLSQANLMVLPSLYEGLPINIIEGMDAGLPVIATDIPGTRELVIHGETGWLVPPRDPAALAEMIQKVFVEPQQTEKIRRKAKETSVRYSMEETASRYEELYSNLHV